jgi:hypothetical protein
MHVAEIFRHYLGWCPNLPAIRSSQRDMRGMEEETGLSRGDRPAGGINGWIGRNGQASVAITTGLCLIALTVILKNVLLVPADTLNRDIILYIIIYCGFVTVFTPVKDHACPEMPGRWPLVWCAVSVIMTLAIIGFYAL